MYACSIEAPGLGIEALDVWSPWVTEKVPNLLCGVQAVDKILGALVEA